MFGLRGKYFVALAVAIKKKSWFFLVKSPSCINVAPIQAKGIKHLEPLHEYVNDFV
jgi:hypothetical protein